MLQGKYTHSHAHTHTRTHSHMHARTHSMSMRLSHSFSHSRVSLTPTAVFSLEVAVSHFSLRTLLSPLESPIAARMPAQLASSHAYQPAPSITQPTHLQSRLAQLTPSQAYQLTSTEL